MGIIYGLCCCAVVSVVKPNSINMGASAKVICSLVTVTFFMYSASSLECLEWSGRDNNITRITCDVCAAGGVVGKHGDDNDEEVVFGGACLVTPCQSICHVEKLHMTLKSLEVSWI